MNPDSRAQMVALLPRLRRFCCGLTGSELEGDELVQMTCERALSRRTQGEVLAQKQMVQQYVADSFIQLEQFRLLVLYTAWLIDQGRTREARTYIAAVKVQTAEVLHDVVRRAMHVHGALGCSNEMPLARMWMNAPVMGIADGPTEVHKVTVARSVLKAHEPYEGLWPRDFLPERVAEAKTKIAARLGVAPETL